MSAYIVPKAHIDALVRLSLEGPSDRGPKYPGDGWLFSVNDPDALGNALVKENVESVHYRYPDTVDDPASTPGPIEHYYDQPYHYEPGRRLTTIEAFVAIAGYRYQACEHPGWGSSWAHEVCEGLTSTLITCLPGWDEAQTWEIS